MASEGIPERRADSLRKALKSDDDLAFVEVVPKSGEELPTEDE